ncbi:MAG TPA: M48 family metalloprotease [Streptosporangiaceae bacterium]
MIRRSCLAGVILSYLPTLIVAGLVAAVAAVTGELTAALWLAVATVVGYVYLYGRTRHQRLQYQGGVRAARRNQPELVAIVDEVMARAGIRRLDGVWLVPGANAGALAGHRDWLGRRHLGLTIGLLTAAHLDTAELKAVLAHEAGHLTDTSRLRLRLCARRRQASSKLTRRGSRPLRWYWNWFLTVTRQLALDSERHADRLAVSMFGAQLAARAHYRVAEASAVHAITIGRIVRPLWDRRITPATLFEAYDAVWTQSPQAVRAAIEAHMNAPDSPGDTHPGLAGRCGGNHYRLAPGLRGDLPLAGLADLDRRCSATLAREQLHLMTAMSWPQIKARLAQEAPPGDAPTESAVTASQDPVS